MKRMNCEHIRLWMHNIFETSPPVPPPADYYTHIADCALCRGALIMLLPHMLTSLPDDSSLLAGHKSASDLAAFIEYEALEGTLAAAQVFPHVWIGLLHDADLAETYRLTRHLLEAEERNELPSIRQTLAASVSRPGMHGFSLRLKRTFFNQAFLTLPPSLCLERGAGQGETVVIEEDTSAGIHFNLSIQHCPDNTWKLIATISPPLPGTLVFTLGEQVFRAPLDAEGTAVASSVPAGLLMAPDGPDLVVGLETHESPANQP